MGTTADISKILLILKVNNDYALYNLHPENYVNRILFKRVLTNILFNGKIKYNIPYDTLAQSRGLNKASAFVAYPWRCTEILENDIYMKKNTDYTKYDLDPNCVTGYWDGNSSLHEYLLNHFILLYNEHHTPIYGYIGRDSSWDDYTESNVSVREIVWFNNEKMLTPFLMYFKNHIISDEFEFYKALHNYLKNYEDAIINKQTTELSRNQLSLFSEKLCKFIDEYKKNIFNSQPFIDKKYFI